MLKDFNKTLNFLLCFIRFYTFTATKSKKP